MRSKQTSPEAGIALGGKRPKAKPKPKRSIIHVVYSAKLKAWLVRFVKIYVDNAPVMRELRPDPYPTKREAMIVAVRWAKECQPSSLRIHGKDGKFQEERTYPRSSDPRRTKG